MTTRLPSSVSGAGAGSCLRTPTTTTSAPKGGSLLVASCCHAIMDGAKWFMLWARIPWEWKSEAMWGQNLEWNNERYLRNSLHCICRHLSYVEICLQLHRHHHACKWETLMNNINSEPPWKPSLQGFDQSLTLTSKSSRMGWKLEDLPVLFSDWCVQHGIISTRMPAILGQVAVDSRKVWRLCQDLNGTFDAFSRPLGLRNGTSKAQSPAPFYWRKDEFEPAFLGGETGLPSCLSLVCNKKSEVGAFYKAWATQNAFL